MNIPGMLFPYDANTQRSASTTGCTIPPLGVDGCESGMELLYDVPTGERITVLYANITQVNAGNDAVIKCGNKVLARSFQRTGDNWSVEFCGQDVYYGSVSTGVMEASITYLDYDLAVANMATDTPFTAYASFDNGVFHYYNPFQAMIGISLIFIAVFCVIFGVAKFIESRKT